MSLHISTETKNCSEHKERIHEGGGRTGWGGERKDEGMERVMMETMRGADAHERRG